jgi:hypothetical protein
MANWSNPTLTSLYTDFVTEVKNRDVDLALGLDPATTSPTNVPANAIRWNSASFKYQKWDGSTWNDLSTKYIFTAVEVSGSTVPVNGMYLSTTNTLNFSTASTASRLTIDGSGNVNIDSGTFYVDAVNNRVGVGTITPFTPLAVSGGITGGNTAVTNTEIAFPSAQANSYLRLLGNYQVGSGRGGTIQLGGKSFTDVGNVGAFLISAISESPQTDALTFSTQTSFNNAITERMRLDLAGNLGLGVVPSAWRTTVGTKVFQFGLAGALYAQDSSGTYWTSLTSNAFQNTSNQNAYINAGFATSYTQVLGQHIWSTAPSGTAGAAITFTQAMTLNASGSLLLGTTSSRGNFYNGSSGYDLYMQVESINYGAGCSYVRNSPDSASAVLIFGKTRSGSLGGNAIVANNDNIGTISFQGSDGSEFVPAAAITAHVDGTPGTNDMPGLLVFSTTADGAATPTKRMSIGNAGVINTYTATGDSLNIRNAAAAGTATGLIYGLYSATSTSNGTVSFTVWSNGNVVNTNGSYGTISDAKLKENIVDANSQWDDIKSLQVRNYNFKEGQTHTQIGLVAQEVELISPGLVSESPDRDAEGNDLGTVTKSVNLSVLYMKAVKALQEAMERIETLEAKVAALEAR